MIDKKANKILVDGVEVTSRLTWEKWKPGQEYTKYMMMKNVTAETKYLTYRIPSTSFYITKYPRKITLFCGTSMKLPVIFRPVSLCAYADSISFSMQSGSFSVDLHGLLPGSDITFPHSLKFGLCAVKDSVWREFKVKNNSESLLLVQFECSPPFEVCKENVMIEPQSTSALEVLFTPQVARHFEETLTCIVDPTDAEESSPRANTIALQAIAKYPHLSVTVKGSDGCQFDFGSCPAGSSHKGMMCIENLSEFAFPYQIHQSSKDATDSAFSCSEYQGTIASGQKLNLGVVFKPTVPFQHYCDDIEVLSIGGICSGKIALKGESIGPHVEVICPSGVNFGLVDCGARVERSFQLRNNSSFPSYFKFEIDNNNSVFEVTPVCGKIPSHAVQTVVATFRPCKPINFYRRVTCLVHDQGPICVDLFGTCHDKLVQPVTLKWKQVEAFNQTTGDVIADTTDVTHSSMTAYGRHMDSPSKPSKGRPVTIDCREIDFGRCDPAGFYQKTFNITNHSDKDVVCTWITGSEQKGIFSVTPEESTLQAYNSASFRLNFQPRHQGSLHCAEFEAYLFYKRHEDHRTTDDDTFQPPWCLTVRATGHTFPLQGEPYLPKFEMDKSQLFFPPKPVACPSYATLLLRNRGDTPLMFKFEEDQENVFTCKPTTGLLHNEFQIVTFCAIPGSQGTVSKQIKCLLNGNDSFKETVTCIAAAEDILVQISDEHVLFKPTCIGTSSSRQMTIRNMSRLQLQFSWAVSSKDQSVLRPGKETGMLMPLESQIVEWYFTPADICSYSFDVKLAIKTMFKCASNLNQSKTHRIKLTGRGHVGLLAVDADQLDFGDVVVGSLNHRIINLVNKSDCDVRVELLCSINDSPLNQPVTFHCSRELELSHGGCYQIPALATCPAKLFVKPSDRKSSQANISYILKFNTTADHQASIPVREPTSLLSITYNGVFPLLTVDDVRGSGSLQRTAKTRLWDMLSLESLNDALSNVPERSELKYEGTTRHSTRRRIPINTQAMIDFDFGSSYSKADPSRLHLSIRNTGATPCSWHLLLPTDLKLELDHWAEDDLFAEDELHEMHVMDNDIFQMEPRHGKLGPTENQAILLTYNHTDIGSHRLPVLFKIDNGREILLVFTGTTVSQAEPHLHFTTTHHQFQPQAIGQASYPVQFYQLCNGGSVPLRYVIDATAIRIQQKVEFGHVALDCLDPCNEIAAGSTHDVAWRFHSLEEREYKIEVPITVVRGKDTTVTLSGKGYRPHGNPPAPTVFDSVPITQSIFLPEQIASLSQEMINFGIVPLFATHRKSVFLKNRSMQDSVTFQWMSNSVISILPRQGVIAPGQSEHCRIVLFDKGSPAICNKDLTCEIINRREHQTFTKDMAHWEDIQEQKKHHFVITDQKPPLSKHTAPLPPISPSEPEDDRPSPPQPFQLHLGVSYETATISSYATDNAHQVDEQFFHRFPLTYQVGAADDAIPCTNGESDIMEIVISHLLRDILADDNFIKSIKSIQSEPIPYFCMIDSKSTKDASVENQQSSASVDSKYSDSHLRQRRHLKSNETFRQLTESVLEETLWNLMTEASLEEIKLTARPRMVVLPPSQKSTE